MQPGGWELLVSYTLSHLCPDLCVSAMQTPSCHWSTDRRTAPPAAGGQTSTGAAPHCIVVMLVCLFCLVFHCTSFHTVPGDLLFIDIFSPFKVLGCEDCYSELRTGNVRHAHAHTHANSCNSVAPEIAFKWAPAWAG